MSDYFSASAREENVLNLLTLPAREGNMELHELFE
jgi:hypothetical protein